MAGTAPGRVVSVSDPAPGSPGGPLWDPEAIPAATIIPLRDAAGELEVLMLRRDDTLRFAAGMWVFPGGGLDPADFPGGSTPSEPTAVEEPSAPPSDDAPMESIELDDPAQTVEFSEPVDSIAAEAPVESVEVEAPVEYVEAETPVESVEAEVPADTVEAEVPAEPAAVEAPEEPVTPEPTAAPATFDAASLSEEDVDRIARRLMELAGDRIEHIAWEVIPDMAEMVVRERVRELEGEPEQ